MISSLERVVDAPDSFSCEFCGDDTSLQDKRSRRVKTRRGPFASQIHTLEQLLTVFDPKARNKFTVCINQLKQKMTRISNKANLTSLATSQKWDEVKERVENGADINAKDQDGKTALHWAAYWISSSDESRMLTVPTPELRFVVTRPSSS
jgi:hypothetical protein